MTQQNLFEENEETPGPIMHYAGEASYNLFKHHSPEGKVSSKKYFPSESLDESNSIDDVVLSKEEKIKTLSKQEKIKEFMNKGSEIYSPNVKSYYSDSKNISLIQANLLATYFPFWFNDPSPKKKQKPGLKPEEFELTKTIFQIRDESYFKVHIIFNNTYQTYLNPKKG